MLDKYYLTLPAQHKQILLSCPLLSYKGLNILTLTGHLIIDWIKNKNVWWNNFFSSLKAVLLTLNLNVLLQPCNLQLVQFVHLNFVEVFLSCLFVHPTRTEANKP